MIKSCIHIRFQFVLGLVFALVAVANANTWIGSDINPNQYEGTDTERIIKAIAAAKGHSDLVRIPRDNKNGSHIWMIDSAILLPSNMVLILDNCTLQLSDKSRDNMFRSDNVGVGIEDIEWNHQIKIIGQGDVVLRGANNPRATGDAARTLVLDPELARKNGLSRVSYGSDAGKKNVKQKGDWRNIMILMGYVNGFELRNVRIENTHGWSVSFERVWNADLSDIYIHNTEYVEVDGKKRMTSNKDGINLRQGCKYFRINNISGKTGDDFIALSSLDTEPGKPKPNGNIEAHMVTSSRYYGSEDDIEEITITNITCENRYRGIAIRASDSASIHHVYINGLVFKAVDNRYDAILIGGKGYGNISQPGKINNIYAMNVIGNGLSLVRIEAPVKDCHFMNGLYSGENPEATLYKIDVSEVENVTEDQWRRVN
ncbi:glycosyl hydrolase family 28 protein [Membranihabitans marinus]|uniref:glycosyl hydrolase family 28 protein n=1 Tax=Membranihabitans marinus TaxID=1227546 RepID=UPI001EFF9618|nr:glycosyl hydrolase family 28 protein [Membranihabitans marinus]